LGEFPGLRPLSSPVGGDHTIPIDALVGRAGAVVACRERMRMARKPNYRFERMERERAKTAKKAARAKARAEKVEKRKADRGELGEQPEQPEQTEQVAADE